jgi:hypothetical protein
MEIKSNSEKIAIQYSFITNKVQASIVAEQYLKDNPGFIWKGEWETIIDGELSVFYVYKNQLVDINLDKRIEKSAEAKNE